MTQLSTYAYHIGCILKVLIYIEEHLDEPTPLEKMAKIAKISPYYFHRLFRAYVGQTVTEYKTELRLRRAAERLQYSDTPITDIALDSGYETPSAFTKVFNQVMGESPRQYRKKMQAIVREIIERTSASIEQQFVSLQPEYLQRKDEPVLFIRRIGDYQESSFQAFEALGAFLETEGLTAKVKSFYCMALDDPLSVERSQCRFDACVALSDNTVGKGEVGQKVLRGGHFAVFTIHGRYSELEETWLNIFRLWYPASNVCLAETDPFCEFIDFTDRSKSEHEGMTKLYIPLMDQ